MPSAAKIFFSCRGKQKQEDTKIAASMNKRSESCTGSWSHSDWWEGWGCSFSVIPSHASGLMRVPVFIYFKFECAYVILCMLPATAGPSTGLRCFGMRWSICSDFHSIFALESSILSLRGGGIIVEVILHISSFIHIYRGVKLDFCSYFFIININNHQGVQLCFNNKCILDFNSPDFLLCVCLSFGVFFY